MARRQGFSPRKILLILLLVAVVGFFILLITQEQLIRDTWQTLLDANWRWVALLPVLQIVNYFFIGNYYRSMFSVFGTQIRIVRAWGVVAAMNFVNQVLPSGGLSGITYLAYGFRDRVESGKTTLIQIGRYMFAFTAYAIFAPLAVFFVITGGGSNQLRDAVDEASSSWEVLLIVVIFLALIALVLVAFFNRRVAHVTGRTALRALNWVNHVIFHRKKPIEMNFLKQLNREFHEGADLIKHRGLPAFGPGIFMLLSVATEVFIVYVSTLAVDAGVGIGVVFLAFIAANIVGTVSVIPGDVGVHEATVILVLVAFGADAAAATSATLLYRVFNKFIFLPVGFYFYTRILKPAVDASRGANG